MKPDTEHSIEAASTVLIHITLPVFNEEAQLSSSVSALDRFLKEHLPHDYEIIIANNASTDRTLAIAYELARQHSCVRVLHLNEKGRGRAVKKAWRESRADVLSYMDVDLSTELSAFPPLIEALTSRNFDLGTGSRLLKSEWTNRGWKREFISRSYNRLVRAMFRTRFSDAQCGFKAITRPAASELLPLIEDENWFFDTELLVVAEKLGYRLFDLPVHWTDDPDSRVKIIRTALEDIRGLLRLRRNFLRGKYAGREVRRLSRSNAPA